MAAVGDWASSRRGYPRLFVLLLLTATGLAYAPTWQADFVWDDYEYVVENETLRDLDGLRRIWFEPRATPQYYPLVFTTFWIEHQTWQLQPAGYHAINVLLHAINALLLWTLLRKLSLPGAWLAALIFALHPVHVESVAWIAERKNVLCGLFYLSAALAFLRFRGLELESQREHWRFYFAALGLYILALLSKSVSASLPAAILLVIYWKTGRVRLRDVGMLLPFFLIGIAAGLNTVWLERSHVGAAGDEWSFTFPERWLIASRALCFYPAKLLWPVSLTFNYPRWNIDAARWHQYLFGVAVVGFLVSLWWRRSSIGRGPIVSALFFAGTLFPALGFIDLYPMRFSFVADHFQYLASIGVIAPFAAGIARITSAADGLAPRWFSLTSRAAIAFALAALVGLTHLQTRIYRDEETLWRDTLSRNPQSWMAHNNLGRILGYRLEHEQAMRHFRRAVELKSDYYVAETNLAEALIKLGEHQRAVGHLRHALEIEPLHAEAHYQLWLALGRLGRWDEAVHHLRLRAAMLSSFDAHFGAGHQLSKAGRHPDSLIELKLAEQLRPHSHVVAFARGNEHMMMNEPEQAVEAYQRATELSPEWAVPENRLGLAYERMGDLRLAEIHFARAISLDPELASTRKNLARIRALRGETAPRSEE